MNEIRLGLLGAGRWGQRYIATIHGLAGMRLAALASRNPASARLVAQDCRISADWRDVIQARDVDAIIIATPPQLHAEMALAAIAAERPVLIEKPLTLAPDDALQIEQEAGRHGVLAMVGHTQLFNSAFRSLKHHLPELGPVRRVISTSGNWGPFRADLSALWDYAPHDVSMCLDLLQKLPDRLSARRDSRQPVDTGFGERYLLTLAFGEVSAEIQVGNLLKPKRRRFEVIGDSGALIFDDLARPSRLMRRTGVSESPLPDDLEMPLAAQIREFVAAVADKRAADPSLRIGREVVEILARCDAKIAA